MKIVSANLGSVTNVEALELLRERQARRAEEKREYPAAARTAPRRLREADDTAKRCAEYLEATPAGRQDVSMVASCMDHLTGKAEAGPSRDLGLSPDQRLVLVNLAPANRATVVALVDDDDRPDGDVDEILDLSKKMLAATEDGV
mmetsp:Transcript_11347/g.34941  ORF Transcript_11347/g.34941 Transcript_11347/m.34941 type:complete len:145 (-) Transcript_11347:25-459(-)